LLEIASGGHALTKTAQKDWGRLDWAFKDSRCLFASMHKFICRELTGRRIADNGNPDASASAMAIFAVNEEG
jgi:hypothetical protein